MSRRLMFVLQCIFLLYLALSAACQQQPQQQRRKHWVLLKIEKTASVQEAFDVTIAKSRHVASSHAVHSSERFLHRGAVVAPSEHHVSVFVESTESTQSQFSFDAKEVFETRSSVHYDGIAADGKHLHGGFHSRGNHNQQQQQGHVFLPIVLDDAPEATALEAGTTTAAPLLLHVVKPSSRGQATTAHRQFRLQSYSSATQLEMSESGINVTVIQQVATGRSRSITFLSSGYTASEKSKFETDALSAVTALQSTVADVDPAPWPRYFPLLNLYSVFEPSVDAGASRPTGPGYSCDATTQHICGPTSVNNNLDCAYGTPTVSILSCDQSKVFTLASYAPSIDLIVVLVNDVDYGGIGTDAFAVIINAAAYMSYLLIHELNHVVAGLGDEYSYGFSQPSSEVSLANCAPTSVSSAVPWTYWIQEGKADVTPSAGCSFDNYYRPTSNKCVMHSTQASSMCSVCQEQLALSLYSTSPGLALDEPRCPPLNLLTYVAPTSSVTLTINHLFVLFNTNVSVTWTLPNGQTIAATPSISVLGSTLTTGDNFVTVTIVDNSPYVRASKLPAAANFSSQFILSPFVAGTTSCSTVQCTASTGAVYSYCGTCLQGTCSNDVIITPVTYSETAPPGSIEQDENTVNVVAIVLAAIGGGFLLVSIVVYCACRRCQVKTVAERPSFDQTLEKVVLVMAGVVLALVVLAIVIAVKYLPQTAMFGYSVLVGTVVICAAVYLLAVAKFVAALFDASMLVCGVGVVIFVLSLGLFGVGIFSIWIYNNVGSSTFDSSMASAWQSAASSSPSVICGIQSALSCSGYYYSCTPTTSSYCPSGCSWNSEPNACRLPWQHWLQTHTLPIGVVLLVCAFIFLLSSLCDCIHAARDRRAKQSAAGRRSYRKDPRPPVPPITTKEVEMLKSEFHRQAEATTRDGDGLHGDALVNFVRDVFGEEPPVEDREQLHAAGNVTADEFLKLYFPHSSNATSDPRQLTPEEAEKAGDVVELQQMQFEKLSRFMRASGTLSPAQLFHLYVNYTKNHFVTDTDEFLSLIRDAAQRHLQTPEGKMCQPLTPNELEGLRCAWVAINPKIVGTLDDAQIDRLFQWTHGTVLHSHEHFIRWKDSLDVRKVGTVGWGEFCYPFAQRYLLRRAKEYLHHVRRNVTHEMLTKQQVAEEFSEDLVNRCFLIFEEEVPIERVLEQALRQGMH